MGGQILEEVVIGVEADLVQLALTFRLKLAQYELHIQSCSIIHVIASLFLHQSNLEFIKEG